jgi:hypothetical protein
MALQEGNTESAAPASAPAGEPSSGSVSSVSPDAGGAPEFDMEAGLAELEKGLSSELADDEATPQAEKPAVEPKGVVAPAAEPTAPAVAQPGAVAPPDTWTKEGKAAWASLPPLVQQEITKREADMQRGFQELGAHKDISVGFQKVLEPYAQIIQQYGINPWDNVRTLMDSQAKLIFGTPEQKLQVVKAAAEAAGLDLTRVVAGETENVVDQRYVALQGEIRRLNAQLGQVSGTMANEKTQQLEASIWAFANDATKAPHFWDVAADMAQLSEQNPRLSVEKLYEQAVWQNPVTRQKMIEAQTAASQQAQARKQADHARKSRAATSANVETEQRTRRGATTDDESLEDSIRASLKEIRSRN